MIQKPKGTYDLYGKKGKEMIALDNVIRALVQNYNFEYFRTPIFEASELFHRGIGEATDIVSKETYDFKDRSNRSLTLRPEGTAAVVRSIIEDKLYARSTLPIKVWYTGPMFRYERPQVGRNRELFQWGLEVFGSHSPMSDAEVMSIPMLLFDVIGLNSVVLKVNSLGDKETRIRYRDALLDYFKPYYEELSEDSKVRFEKNPLRILDSKDPHDKTLIEKAPKLYDYLTADAKDDFNTTLELLGQMNIPYVIEDTLVRGFDYYTGIVFEYEVKTEKLGNQNVIGGGGRYDGLVETLGGPSLPAIGLGIGLDRLMIALELFDIELTPESNLDVYVIPVSKNELTYAFEITTYLRKNGFVAEIDHMNRNLKSNLKQSDRLGAKYIIIIGEKEQQEKVLVVKNNETKEEFKIYDRDLIEFFDKEIEEVQDED